MKGASRGSSLPLVERLQVSEVIPLVRSQIQTFAVIRLLAYHLEFLAPYLEHATHKNMLTHSLLWIMKLKTRTCGIKNSEYLQRVISHGFLLLNFGNFLKLFFHKTALFFKKKRHFKEEKYLETCRDMQNLFFTHYLSPTPFLILNLKNEVFKSSWQEIN